MTDKQKTDIMRMRQSGKTYKHIADMLGISINSVKSYCRRNTVNVNPDAASETKLQTKTVTAAETVSYGSVCQNCGREIVQKARTKKRKFCCDECRRQWWNTHPEEVNRKALYKSVCAFCGKEFTAYGNNHRKYCSHQCYISARFGG